MRDPITDVAFLRGFGTLRIFPYLIALAIIVPAGIVQGRWTGRWSPPERFDARLEALRRIPLQIGDWEGVDIEPEAKTWERAGVAGGMMRRYVKSGSAVTILIVCGRPGPTSVHTPEVCYAGAGYDAVTAKSKVAVRSGTSHSDDFWTSDFLKRDTTLPEYLRIFHAWSVDGRWRASSNPRADFAGSTVLYKLYLVRPMPRVEKTSQEDPAFVLARGLLPEITKAIGPN